MNNRIGLYIDGNFLYHVNQAYKKQEDIKTTISYPKLFSYLEQKMRRILNTKNHYKIQKKNFYKGWISPEQVGNNNRGVLTSVYNTMEELNSNGINSKFIPVKKIDDFVEEKEVDSQLICDALVDAAKDQYDILVVLTADRDFNPLLSAVRSFKKISCLLSFEVGTISPSSVLLESSDISIIPSINDNADLFKPIKTNCLGVIYKSKDNYFKICPTEETQTKLNFSISDSYQETRQIKENDLVIYDLSVTTQGKKQATNVRYHEYE